MKYYEYDLKNPHEVEDFELSCATCKEDCGTVAKTVLVMYSFDDSVYLFAGSCKERENVSLLDTLDLKVKDGLADFYRYIGAGEFDISKIRRMIREVEVLSVMES